MGGELVSVWWVRCAGFVVAATKCSSEDEELISSFEVHALTA